MANPIKASSILVDDGAIQKMINDFKELEKVTVSAIAGIKKEAKELQKALKNTNSTTARGRDETEKAAKRTEELERLLKKYNDSLKENAIEVAAVKNAQATLNRLNKAEAKLIAAKEDSYDALSAQLTINQIRLKQLTEEERENTKEGKKLVKETNKLTDSLKRMDKQLGVNSRNVGNYKDDIKDAIGETKSFSGALKSLSRSPVVGFVGVLVGGVTALFGAFLKSEKGVNLLNKAMGVADAVMSNLVELSVSVANKLEFAFNNPKKAIEDLGKSLVTNILNRFKAIPLVGKAVLDSLKAVWNGDFEALEKAGVDAMSAVNQAITGFDKDGQKEIADLIKETVKEVSEESEAFGNLRSQKRKVAQVNRELIRTLEDLLTVEELNNSIASDSTKSFKEREEAAEKAREALEKRAEKEIQIAKNNLSLINQEISLRKANGEALDSLLDQQIGAYREVIAAERDLTLSIRDNEKERSELKQDRLERDLDILLDAFDNQKSINERQLNDDELTLKQKAAIFQETQNLADKSFQKQIETIQKFTGIAIDSNDLISEADAVLLNEKIRGLGLSEIIEGRLLEIIRDRRTALRDVLEVRRELTKERNQDIPELLPAFEHETNQIEIITNRAVGIIKKGRQDIEDDEEARKKGGDHPKNIYELLGFDTEDPKVEGATTALEFAKQKLIEFAALRTQLAQQNVAASNMEVAETQRALQIELEARNAGFANRAETAQKEFDLAKQNQKKALDEKRKAQRAEQRLATIQQAVNLTVMASKVASQLGFPFAIPAIALMFGAFAAAKIRANKLTKQQFGKGTYQDINWGASHDSGNDIPIGLSKDGKQMMTVERGESMAVFNRRAKKQYGNRTLKNVVDLINKGQFDTWSNSDEMLGGIALNFHQNTNTDNSKMENSLEGIRKNTERKIYQNGNQTIEYYKNRKTIIVN